MLESGNSRKNSAVSFHLAENTKICYTYDSLSRVTDRTIKNECDLIISSENYSYDAAGNIIDAPNSCFLYDANNRLIVFDGNSVSYDMDGNMVRNSSNTFEYDSANRLIKAGGHTYTYNAEDVRIRNLCSDADTTYTYNTNCKLSQLLTKTTNGIITKYVYGHGLIGEEKEGYFKTYHFDYRGSTVAITDTNGYITDTFKYDTYGNLISRTGYSFVIFGYNGRDGVITDKNGLIYMRARYYSPAMRRFINADILHGEISDSTSLNRYSYVNGNPVSFVDPFGLSAERGKISEYTISSVELYNNFKGAVDGFELIIGDVKFVKNGEYINIKGDRSVLAKYGIKQTRIRADNIKNFEGIANLSNTSSAVSSALKSKSNWALAGITIAIETTYDMSQYDDIGDKLIIGSYDIVSGVIGAGLSMAGGAAVGAKVGTMISPGWGTLAGIVVGGLIGLAYDALVDEPVKEYLIINVIEG